MDLNKVAVKAVSDAFIKVGTLAVNVILQNREATFNFNTLATSTTVAAPKIVKAIRLESKRRPNPKENANVITVTLMFKAEDAADLAIYDLVEYAGFIWNISHPATSNGFTATAEISREY